MAVVHIIVVYTRIMIFCTEDSKFKHYCFLLFTKQKTLERFTYWIIGHKELSFKFQLLLLFIQDNLFSTYCTVINEGPAIEVLIIFKAPIWATKFTLLNQTTQKESPSVRIPCGFQLKSFGKFRLDYRYTPLHPSTFKDLLQAIKIYCDQVNLSVHITVPEAPTTVWMAFALPLQFSHFPNQSVVLLNHSCSFVSTFTR